MRLKFSITYLFMCDKGQQLNTTYLFVFFNLFDYLRWKHASLSVFTSLSNCSISFCRKQFCHNFQKSEVIYFQPYRLTLKQVLDIWSRIQQILIIQQCSRWAPVLRHKTNKTLFGPVNFFSFDLKLLKITSNLIWTSKFKFSFEDWYS